MPVSRNKAEKIAHVCGAIAVGILALSACTPTTTSPEQIQEQACIDTLDRVAVWADLTAEQREDLLKEIDCTPPGWEERAL